MVLSYIVFVSAHLTVLAKEILKGYSLRQMQKCIPIFELNDRWHCIDGIIVVRLASYWQHKKIFSDE